MLDSNIKNNYQVLIIDDVVEYNDLLKSKLNRDEFDIYQAYDVSSADKYLNQLSKELSLVILSIDIVDLNIKDILQSIEKQTEAKVIILSEDEDSKQRESYFKQGILDYHLKMQT